MTTNSHGYRSPVPLTKDHAVGGFHCGEAALDDWLKRHALASQSADAARVYVVTQSSDSTVLAYYALAAAQVSPEEATARALQGQPRTRPLPALLLARFAVHLDHQRQGLGRALLRDALARCISAADAIGARLILVHAKTEAAKAWYLQFGFQESPSEPLTLSLLLKDARQSLRRPENP